MVLVKTALGQAAFKERSPQFSARQRSAYILFDGRKSVEQVMAATAGMGVNQADVEYLLDVGFLVGDMTDALLSQPAVLMDTDHGALDAEFTAMVSRKTL